MSRGKNSEDTGANALSYPRGRSGRCRAEDIFLLRGGVLSSYDAKEFARIEVDGLQIRVLTGTGTMIDRARGTSNMRGRVLGIVGPVAARAGLEDDLV